MSEKQTTEETQDEITRKANAIADANIYLLNNSYLTLDEKQEVEFWFQLPGDIMLYAFLIIAVWSATIKHLSWGTIIGIPLAVNVAVCLVNWYFYNKNLVYKLYLTFLHRLILYLVSFGVAVFLFFKGAILLAIISLVTPFGLFVFFEPSNYLYPILSTKYRMHPKFAFFKKEYGRSFPFEKYLD